MSYSAKRRGEPPCSIKVPASSLAYPFPAIVGHEAAKRALLLASVDPDLKGVLIAGGVGNGKSLLASSFSPLFPATEGRLARQVRVPLNVTEERLTGGLDLDHTLKTGTRHPSRGLLARADGGVLLVDEINLLDSAAVERIAAALESGRVRLEREGISAVWPARFLLIATYNPAEGDVSNSIRDRLGLIVEPVPAQSVEERVDTARHSLEFHREPGRFIKQWQTQTEQLRARIEQARKILMAVRVSREAIRHLALAAVGLGVEGNRADVFAARAARASAALAGRAEVAEEDLVTAIQLSLVPRATTVPARPPAPGEEESSPKCPPAPGDHHPDGETAMREQAARAGELIFEALDSQLPSEPLSGRERAPRRSAPGKRGEAAHALRGRYVGSSARRIGSARLAIDATLRAAAPFQQARSTRGAGRAIRIEASDLRFKRLKHRAGMLFIFAVDASGSMAVNRMARAKGAVTRLLQDAYLHRDKVALISFRNSGAELLLPPTRSVELGKRVIDALPSGGATPIASALILAREVARIARARDRLQPLLVLLTDGRANVGLKPHEQAEPDRRRELIRAELEQLGTELRGEQIESVVIDTRLRFTGGSEGGELADLLGGRYLYLPRADDEAIYSAVAATARNGSATFQG